MFDMLGSRARSIEEAFSESGKYALMDRRSRRPLRWLFINTARFISLLGVTFVPAVSVDAVAGVGPSPSNAVSMYDTQLNFVVGQSSNFIVARAQSFYAATLKCWADPSSALPPNVTVITDVTQGTCSVSGTPVRSSVGTYPTRFSVVIAAGTKYSPTITKSFQGTVVQPFTASASVVSLTVGQEIKPEAKVYPVVVRGGMPPYKFAITGGTVPSGMTLNKDGSLQGTPARELTYSLRLRVSDSAARSAAVSLTLPVVFPDVAVPYGDYPVASLMRPADGTTSLVLSTPTPGTLAQAQSADASNSDPSVERVGFARVVPREARTITIPWTPVTVKGKTGAIATFKVQSSGAFAVRAYLSGLPDDESMVVVRSPQSPAPYPGAASASSPQDGAIWTNLVDGDTAMIDILRTSPPAAGETIRLTVPMVMHVYASADKGRQLDPVWADPAHFISGSSYQFNAQCLKSPMGATNILPDDFKKAIAATASMSFVKWTSDWTSLYLQKYPESEIQCNGALVDVGGTPMFATAGHCTKGRDLSTAIIRFNMTTTACGDTRTTPILAYVKSRVIEYPLYAAPDTATDVAVLRFSDNGAPPSSLGAISVCQGDGWSFNTLVNLHNDSAIRDKMPVSAYVGKLVGTYIYEDISKQKVSGLAINRSYGDSVKPGNSGSPVLVQSPKSNAWCYFGPLVADLSIPTLGRGLFDIAAPATEAIGSVIEKLKTASGPWMSSSGDDIDKDREYYLKEISIPDVYRYIVGAENGSSDLWVVRRHGLPPGPGLEFPDTQFGHFQFRKTQFGTRELILEGRGVVGVNASDTQGYRPLITHSSVNHDTFSTWAFHVDGYGAPAAWYRLRYEYSYSSWFTSGTGKSCVGIEPISNVSTRIPEFTVEGRLVAVDCDTDASRVVEFVPVLLN